MYGTNIFECDPHRDGPGARRPRSVEVPIEYGMVLEDISSGWVGAVTRVEKSGGVHLVELEDRRGRKRSFPLGGGFWLEGKPIIALPPKAAPAQKAPALTTAGGRVLTNSGSIAPEKRVARVARQSRIWVAVQLLEGVDHLEEILEVFGPTKTVRAGVLVDHLVPGSKESRIAEAVSIRWEDAVLVVGHPFVDIWQAVKPQRLGLQAWPDVPRGTDIKHGTLEYLGWPHANQADIAQGWKRILATVRNYKDLEPALLGRVEELIDFVTQPGLE